MECFPWITRVHKTVIIFSILILFTGCGSGGGGGGSTDQQSTVIEGYVTHFAGAPDGPGKSDGTGIEARFSSPRGITTDGTNLYVADSFNHTIRKIVIATGAVTTIAGSAAVEGSRDGTGTAARFAHPSGITIHGTDLYVTDTVNGTIRKIDIPTGAVTTLAGSAGDWGYQDGTGNTAIFDYPYGIATDGTFLYVTETNNHTIRKIAIATGEVTTLAGSTSPGNQDGIGSIAGFQCPQGVTVVGASLYVVDTGNYTIRKIVIATGEVTTFAGSSGIIINGQWDGIGTGASFASPKGVTTDGMNLYVADAYAIRKIEIASGAVTTPIGLYGEKGSQDGTGADARFGSPRGITTDGVNLYVADEENHNIRKVEIATGAVTTLAGTAAESGFQDGIGTAARFDTPRGIASDGTYLYVTDSENYTIRRMAIATGAVTTLAGSAGILGSQDGTGAAARFSYPKGITIQGTNLYVTDGSTIRKVEIATGVVTTFAGSASGLGSQDGIGAAARFQSPFGITTDGTCLYVTDAVDSTIRKIVIATGEVTTFAGSAGNSGTQDGIGTNARFGVPFGIITDGTSLYVTDFAYTIRKIAITTRTVTTLAGSASNPGSRDGIGADARFNFPIGITTDGTSLYVTDSGTIRKVETASGAVTTIAGLIQRYGSEDGTLAEAAFNSPYDLVWVNDASSLFVCDTGNNAIRKVTITSR